MTAPLFVTSTGAGIYVPYKCCLSSMIAAAREGYAHQCEPIDLPTGAPLYGIVRHPASRLESFLRLMCWYEPKLRGLTRDCHKAMLPHLDPAGVTRLEEGRSTIDDVLGALERGFTDPHVDPLSELIPEGVEILRMEDPDTYATLARLLNMEAFPRANVTEKDTPIPWGIMSLQRMFDLRRRDLDRFGYGLFPT